MNDKLGPLDGDIASLLSAERSAPNGGPTPNAHGRVAGRLAATLGIPLLIPGGPFDPSGGDPSGGDPSGGDPTGGPPGDPGVDPSSLADPSLADPSLADPSLVDPSLIDPSLLDPTALTAAGKAIAASAAGKAAAGSAAAGTAAAAGTSAAGTAVAGTAAATTVAAGAAATGAAAGAATGAAAGAGASAAAGAGMMALLTKPLLIGTFVAGTMVGGGTVAVVQPAIQDAPKPKIVYVPRTPAAADLSEAAFADDEELAVEAEMAPTEVAKPVRKRRVRKAVAVKVEKAVAEVPKVEAKAERDGALAKENALVQMARTSLQRQKHAQALSALKDHQRQFPSGKLSEERDALRIFSLIGVGKIDAAKGAARRFGVQYPKSIFATPVKQALKGR